MFLYYFPLGLWIRTIAAGVPLSIGRADPHAPHRRPAGLIVANLVRARKAGLPLTVDQLQSHYPGRRQRRQRRPRADRRAARADPARVAARRRDRPGRPQRARGGADDRQPEGHRDADLPRRRAERHPAQGQGPGHGPHEPRPLVGGAGEETIIARVGEGIVTAIGSADRPQAGAREPRPISQDGAREGARRRHGVRDPLDRHRRHRRRRQHRRRPADRAGRGRPARRAGQGRGTAVRRAWPPSRR